MKFNILQQDLLQPLHAVGRSVGVRVNLPVLENIYLSADGSKLKLAATNLEIGIIKIIPATVLEKGEITVPAKTLIEVVSSLGQSQVEFESEAEILTIKSGKFTAQINGISAQDFPAIPLSDEAGVEFEREAFLNCSQVLFAAAVDEGRPTLTGVLTEVKDGFIDFVATDGFRLAHKRVEVDKDSAKFRNIIPKRTFEEILKVISEEQIEKLTISNSQNQNQMVFTIGNTIISSRLIEGNFPDWKKIIPKQTSTSFVIEKSEAVKAIKLASVFAKNEASVLRVSVKKDSVVFKSSTKELGSQENELEVASQGEAIDIAFNSRFLLDAISNCPSDSLKMEFSGSLSPTLINPLGLSGLEYIVMPVRLN